MTPLNFDNEILATEPTDDIDMTVEAELADELNAMMNYCESVDLYD